MLRRSRCRRRLLSSRRTGPRRARRGGRCRRGWCTGSRDRCARSAPASCHPDDHPAVAVEDEGEVEEAVPGPQVGDVGDPLLVRPGRPEVALQEVASPLERRLVRDRRPALLAAADALEALLAHQPGDAVATDLDVMALRLLPGLADAVDRAVALAGGEDLGHERALFERAAGRLPGPARLVRAHRHADCPTDRLDPESVPPRLHVAAHLRRVGSSSVAKYTDASFKIAFARFSSAFSLRSRFSSSRSSLVSRSRRPPVSASAWRTQIRSASWWTPRSRATCRTGRPDSNTSRTARSRNSNGYFLGAPIAGASPSPKDSAWFGSLQKTQGPSR